MGAKKRPFYRLVVANSTDARDGRFIESIGYYDPCSEPPAVKVNADRVSYWLKCGAQPSDTARALLQKQGVIGGAAAAAPVAEAATEQPAEAKKTRSPRKPAETPQAAE
jgi:small subunit ribosomal protein S16